MISSEARSLDIPMDVDRFADSLRGSKWRDIRRTLGDIYEVQSLYEGPLPGLPQAQVLRLSSGDPDSPIRILIDAVPLSLSRPVLVAGRAVTRVFTSRARERAVLLDQIAVRIHVIEVDGDAADIPPLPLASGLDGGLRLAHSVANDEAWGALRASVQRFRPTLAMDLRWHQDSTAACGWRIASPTTRRGARCARRCNGFGRRWPWISAMPGRRCQTRIWLSWSTA
jgi:hypothetical protein